MGEVWRDFAHRFVAFTRRSPAEPKLLLPMVQR
jgi:hypothetical protein